MSLIINSFIAVTVDGIIIGIKNAGLLRKGTANSYFEERKICSRPSPS